MSHKYLSYIVMDFETGGLKSQENAIVELAALGVDGNTLEPEHPLECIIEPSYHGGSLSYEPGAFQAHGITEDQMRKEGIPLKEMMSRFVDLCVKMNKFGSNQKWKVMLVGKNLGFDLAFLEQAEKYTKVDLSKYIHGHKDHNGKFIPHMIDVEHWALLMFGNDESMGTHKLIDIANKLGVQLVGAHRAMNDVFATYEILVKMVLLLRGMGEGVEKGVGGSKPRARNKFKY